MTILHSEKRWGGKATIKCDYCGSINETFTSRVIHSKRHYCNNECQRLGMQQRKTKVSPADARYRKQVNAQRKNARGKNRVLKYCLKCGKKYEGPPGGFRRSPEPGICPTCTRVFVEGQYTQEDWGAALIN